MRNPHGKEGIEWNGDWADDSELWTAKAKERLHYEPNTEESDGVFWMTNSDFLQQFKYVYVCRELNEKAGWHCLSITSEWYGNSAAGFPGKLPMVPQFKLTLNDPSDGFISLDQLDESGSAFQGKNLVGWMVSKEQGKIMRKLDKRKMIAKAGINNLKRLSAEVDFDEEGSYTIVCGAAKKMNYPGEGKFELKVYCRDPTATLVKLNHNE